MKLQTRTLRAFLVVAIEAFSLVMLASAARTEPMQLEVLPTATKTSQTVVNSANDAPQAATQPVPGEVSDSTTDANTTPATLEIVQPDPPNPPLQRGQDASTDESPQVSQTQTDPLMSSPSEGGQGRIPNAAS